MTTRQILECPVCDHQISLPADVVDPVTPVCESHGDRAIRFVLVGIDAPGVGIERAEAPEVTPKAIRRRG